MTSLPTALRLSVLTRRITAAIAAADLDSVWVTAETSDLRCSGGHCYMELIEKDDYGRQLAKCRAVIWSSTYRRLSDAFAAATGTNLRSDMKIMVKVTVSFHAVYGLSLVINDINPDYTVGDLARRRNEIVRRLKAEGIFDLNRSLPWPLTPVRVAVVSARGAAGFGDFMKHLHNNRLRLRFETDLYEASLQGEHTGASIIAALEAIMERVDSYDCVAIIRGGGAVSDLSSFDDYDLAAHVAQFPLPVIVGIGHERDVTVLDYVANTRVKTPTAAAEELLASMSVAYGAVIDIGRDILDTVRSAIAGRRQQLAYCSGLLPALAHNVVERHRRLTGPDAAARIADSIRSIVERRRERLDDMGARIAESALAAVGIRSRRLSALAEILEAISPEATMRRGYSITRVDGHAVTGGAAIVSGTRLSTTFADGATVGSIAE